ncbi:hypothetical protein ACE10Z_05520 [Bradyrhizobium sp. Pha-3]|uniref:hypothetical protein n=1 Tax=Bradyrhizobium sp. Pha-3 TaxID=208375 RepID=UPI0035D4A249
MVDERGKLQTNRLIDRNGIPEIALSSRLRPGEAEPVSPDWLGEPLLPLGADKEYKLSLIYRK